MRVCLMIEGQEGVSWDDWLALYTEDAEFWVPTWRDEHQLTEDPARELSFIYLQGRALLAERVFRITSGRSAASTPLPRTRLSHC